MGWFNKKEEVPRLAPAQTFPDVPRSQEVPERNLPELPSFPSSFQNERLNQEMVKSAVDDLPSPVENEAMESPRFEELEERPLIPQRTASREVDQFTQSRFPEPKSFQKSEHDKKDKPAHLVQNQLKQDDQEEKSLEGPMMSSEFPISEEVSVHQDSESPKVFEGSIPEPILEPEMTHQTKTYSIRRGKPVHQEEGSVYVRLDKFELAQKSFETVRLKVKDIEAVLKKIQEIKYKEEEELKQWTDEIQNLKGRLEEIDNEIFDQI